MERLAIQRCINMNEKRKKQMKAYKWDFINERYYDYEIPDHYNTPLCTDDMDEVINCAECGTKLKYGDCYTSVQIHDAMGFGYPVCDECYQKEWRIRIRGEQYDQ